MEKDIAYYLTIFKIKGHTTWRMSLNGDKEAFNHGLKNMQNTTITERKDFRFDRIAGKWETLK